MAMGKGCSIPHRRRDESKISGRCRGSADRKLTNADIAHLEEPYVPHRIVGAIDRNPPQGVMLLDEKK